MNSLLSLAIENYRSFFAKQTLNLEGAQSSVITALYGPNAGGKSNTAHALALIKNCIMNSANANWRLPYEPFAFRSDSLNKPSSFDIKFMSDGKVFHYYLAFTQESVTYEKLVQKSTNTAKKKLIFERNENGISNHQTAGKFGFGKKLYGKTRPDTLLITKGREDNNQYSNMMFDFLDKLVLDFPSPVNNNEPLYIEMLQESADLRRKTLDLLHKCDFAIRDIQVKTEPFPASMLEVPFLSEEFKEVMADLEYKAFKTTHTVRDEEGSIVGVTNLDFGNESMGTKAFFQCAVPALKVINEGGVLYLDEFGAYMHPILAEVLLELFRGSENKAGAQLILNTHNTYLMRESLGRDQIFLIEKTFGEESRITPLRERGARNDESFEKRYLQGLYGALPLIG